MISLENSETGWNEGRHVDSADRPARMLLLIGLAAGFVARLVFASNDDGMWWPDEVYQALEPAHRLVFGYGWQAWEFVDGARHWTLPGLVALVMRGAEGAGLPYLPVIKTVCCLAGSATSAAVFALARAQGASVRSAAVVATTFSLMGLAIYMAPRTLSEGLSALPVTMAFALVASSAVPRRRWAVVLAGFLLTLAVGLRLQNGVFCLGALWLAERRARVWLGFTLALGAVAYGLGDAMTWGAPFHSALTYVRFNVFEGRASTFGTAPVLYYVVHLVTAEGVTLLPLGVLAGLGFKHHPKPTVVALAFLAVHSFIPHKELRFIFPVVPLVAAQAALGLDATARRWVAPSVLVLALASAASLRWLTFGRLGLTDPPRQTSALDFGGPENRLLAVAGRRSDLCGLRISSIAHWRTQGYARFHNPAPMYRAERPDEGAGHFNFVLGQRGSVEGVEVATDHGLALIKLATPCTPDPAYDWALE
jgi:GPI mannosyltransferase 3